MFKHLLFFGLFLMSPKVFAWSATYLGGTNWAITCANGTSWSYNGSSAGLDVVGPALCPGGLIAPNVPRGYRDRVAAGIAHTTEINLIKNRQESTEDEVQKARTYPPHGYPCLGCEPCPPGNTGDFCDIVNASRVYLSKWTPRCERNSTP